MVRDGYGPIAPVNGILLLDKEPGPSSAQTLNGVKKRLRGVKVGHLGTLDPFATGLLVCLLGRATRIAPLLSGGRKIYSGEFMLGLTTDTDDGTGAVLSRSDPRVSGAMVCEAAQTFSGCIEQVPPRYSAVHVDGRRAYAYARAGEEVTLTARSVEVEILAIDTVSLPVVRFRIQSSAGFYVRAWARDIGRQLGCGAALMSLRREASAPFCVASAVTPSAVDADKVLPWFAAFSALPSVEVTPLQLGQLAQGDLRACKELGEQLTNESLALYKCAGFPCGLLSCTDQGWRIKLHVGLDEVGSPLPANQIS